jgi:hypothetical protein
VGLGDYTLPYYLVVIAGVMALPFFFAERDPRIGPRLKAALVAAIIIVYLLAMFRTRGVDMRMYMMIYNDLNIFGAADIGFATLIQILNFFGAPFASLMLIAGLASLAALWRLSRHFQVSFALLLVFWFAHLAVVRDFSQFRVGFAVSIALLGITSPTMLIRLALCAVAFTIHFTALALILGYEYLRLVMRVKSPRWRYSLVAAAMGGTMLIGALIGQLAFIDPRIALYLAWDTTGYGAPVESYGALILHGLVLAIAVMGWRGWKGRGEIEVLFWLEVMGIVSFLAFFDVAIFASRITNVVLSLYPVLLIHSVNAIRIRLGGRAAVKLGAGMVALALMLILTARPGSFSIINTIGF